MEPQSKSNKKNGIIIGSIIVIVVVVATIFFGKKTPNTSEENQSLPSTSTQTSGSGQDSSTTTIPVSQIPPVDTNKKVSSVYKDGTYSATGSYMSPGGPDKVSVTLTLASDVITDASVISGAGDHTSQRYQDKFISGYKQYVVGKNIADVHLTKVSGSSLTPIGFNNALSAIETEAKI